MGNQSDAQHQFKDDGQTGYDEREVKAKEMVTVYVNLELVHVDNLHDGRHDEHKAQQDLQGRFTERIRQPRLWLVTVIIVVVIVIIVAAK